MKKYLPVTALFWTITICVLLPLVTFAEKGTKPEKTEKIVLTAQQVEHTVKLLPYFLKNAKGGKGKLKPEDLNTIAIKNGFKDYHEFLQSASMVMMAYAYLQLKSNEALLANQISKVGKTNPDVAKSFQPQMDALAESIKKYEKNLSVSTVKAVLPYMPKIGAILKSSK